MALTKHKCQRPLRRFSEQIIYAANGCPVDFLHVGEPSGVTFFSVGVGSFPWDDDVESPEECVGRSVTAAAVSLPSRNHHGINSEFPKNELESSLVEAAISFLGNDVVALFGFELVNDFRSLRALYSMGASQLELLVDVGCVTVIGVDDRNTFGAGFFAKLLDRFDDVVHTR